MKIRKIVSILLLISFSFSNLHAYAIEILDEDHCNVSEYIDEINHKQSINHSGDVCDVHFEFHIPYILPQKISITTKRRAVIPTKKIHKYQYNFITTLLKPPVTLS